MVSGVTAAVRLSPLVRKYLPNLHRAASHGRQVTVDWVREVRHDKVGQLAAALTYHTLFSLLPTLVLAMVLLHVFVQEDQRTRFRDLIVETILPSAGTGVDPAREEMHEARGELTVRIEALLEQLDKFNFGSIGVVGLLVFIYGATALLATVERCFNAILGVARARPWYLRLALYYAVITLAPLPLIVGQVFQLNLLEHIGQGTWLAWPALIAVFLLPFGTAWLVLFLIYLLLPNTTVPRHAAALGAIIGAILWSLAKEAFTLYVSHAAVSSLYGALALLPLFLLWLWLSWIAVLTGLEFAHTLAARPGRGLRAPRPGRSGPIPLNPAWLLPVAAAVAEGHATGRPRDVSAIAAATGLHVSLAGSLLGALREAGIILALRPDGGSAYDDPPWVPARPADRIPLTELMRAAQHLTPPPDQLPTPSLAGAWGSVDALWQQAAANLSQKSLASLLDVESGIPAVGAASASDAAPRPDSPMETPQAARRKDIHHGS